MQRWLHLVLLIASSASAVCLAPHVAHGQHWPDRRYAVVIGNNLGRADEAPLRYAEDDARRFASVLRRLGGLTAQDTVLLLGDSATAIRQALQDVNRRIRLRGRASRQPATLIVYYSGHAGADGLHAGGDTLAYATLRAMLQRSPARARVLVLDGCRSGELTAVKGARPTAEFVANLDRSLHVEGLAILSSSAAGEDSHESERLGASFFSHHLSTGLLGAADENLDGAVTLREVYSYAYRNTVKASGRTANLQHPTFAYRLKGRGGDMVLTRLMHSQAKAAYVKLASAGLHVVYRGDQQEELVAEIRARQPDTRLALAPGRYLVQYRTRDYYLEYDTELQPGQAKSLADAPARRINYAHLVRKGHNLKTSAHGLSAAAGGRGQILDGLGPALGVELAYQLDLPVITVGARGRVWGSRPAPLTESLTVTYREYALGIVAQHFSDLAGISVGIGLRADAVCHAQAFEGAVTAPARRSYSLAFGGLLTLQRSLRGPLFARLEGGPVTYLLQQMVTEAGASKGAARRTPLTAWVSLGLVWMVR